jgi:hypothetical protein
MIWWILLKLIGLVMIVVGGMLVVMGSGAKAFQEVRGTGATKLGITGVVMGLILLIVGGFILFAP